MAGSTVAQCFRFRWNTLSLTGPPFYASAAEGGAMNHPGRNRAERAAGLARAALQTPGRGCDRGRRHRRSEDQPFRTDTGINPVQLFGLQRT